MERRIFFCHFVTFFYYIQDIYFVWYFELLLNAQEVYLKLHNRVPMEWSTWWHCTASRIHLCTQRLCEGIDVQRLEFSSFHCTATAKGLASQGAYRLCTLTFTAIGHVPIPPLDHLSQLPPLSPSFWWSSNLILEMDCVTQHLVSHYGNSLKSAPDEWGLWAHMVSMVCIQTFISLLISYSV